MNIFNSFDELPGASHISNVEFFGDPKQWNRFDAEQKKELIALKEDVVRRVEQDVRRPSDPDLIRQRINKLIAGLIDKHKDDYADLKKELLEIGVEVLSDSYLYDDYYDEKYGGQK